MQSKQRQTSDIVNMWLFSRSREYESRHGNSYNELYAIGNSDVDANEGRFKSSFEKRNLEYGNWLPSSDGVVYT